MTLPEMIQIPAISSNPSATAPSPDPSSDSSSPPAALPSPFGPICALSVSHFLATHWAVNLLDVLFNKAIHSTVKLILDYVCRNVITQPLFNTATYTATSNHIFLYVCGHVHNTRLTLQNVFVHSTHPLHWKRPGYGHRKLWILNVYEVAISVEVWTLVGTVACVVNYVIIRMSIRGL